MNVKNITPQSHSILVDSVIKSFGSKAPSKKEWDAAFRAAVIAEGFNFAKYNNYCKLYF